MRMIAHDRQTAARGRVVFTYQGDGNLVTRVAVENDRLRDRTPTRAWLATLRCWPAERWADLPTEIAAGWITPEWAREVRPGRWVFATGGRSENERIIEAARRSPAWRAFSEIIETPNGLYIFPTTKEAAAEARAIMMWIVRRAWSRRRIRL